jgi:hypothetical protein
LNSVVTLLGTGAQASRDRDIIIANESFISD